MMIVKFIMCQNTNQNKDQKSEFHNTKKFTLAFHNTIWGSQDQKHMCV